MCSGGSQRTETLTASNSMSGTIVANGTPTDELVSNSSDQEKKSSSERLEETPFLFGENSSTTADSKGSTARFSETSQYIAARNSYVRRIRLLIASGLIAGITPMCVRKRSSQLTLDFALSRPGGSDVEPPRAAS